MRLTLEEVRALAHGVLRHNGLAEAAAISVADVVTRAEADECRSHGLYRLPGYVAAMRSGRVAGDAVPQAQAIRPGLIRVDARRGFAPPAADLGRPALVAAARANGIAAMAITQAHHFSALWADLEPLVAEGLVAWAFVIGQNSVAPHGGSRRLMGTNPIAFGWPRPGLPPFLFDFATSAAARGEVELKRRAGESLPEGWALDAEGRPTRDPGEALAGALLPFGGHKGSALSMMVELIAGPLIGEMTSAEVAGIGITDGGPPPGGELILALDPGGLPGRSAEAFFAEALSQPGLRLPADRRYSARARTDRDGIWLDDALHDEIRALG